MNWYIAFMKCRSSRWKCSFKRAALKTFPIFSGKHLRWSLLFVKLQGGHATLLKKESNTSGFLRILRNFQEQLFYRTPAADSFWNSVSTGVSAIPNNLIGPEEINQETQNQVDKSWLHWTILQNVLVKTWPKANLHSGNVCVYQFLLSWLSLLWHNVIVGSQFFIFKFKFELYWNIWLDIYGIYISYTLYKHA